MQHLLIALDSRACKVRYALALRVYGTWVRLLAWLMLTVNVHVKAGFVCCQETRWMTQTFVANGFHFPDLTDSAFKTSTIIVL